MVPVVAGSLIEVMIVVPDGTAAVPAAVVCVVPSGKMMPVGDDGADLGQTLRNGRHRLGITQQWIQGDLGVELAIVAI